MRSDGAHEAVQRGKRIVLAPQLQARFESNRLQAEEEQKPPERRTMERPLIDLLLIGRRDVTDDAAAWCYELLVGSPVLLQIAASQRQEADAGIAAIGEQPVGQLGEYVIAVQALPASDDDRVDLDDQADNEAHLTPPEFMPLEARVRFAPAAAVAIAPPLGNGPLMLLEGCRNCRSCRVQAETNPCFCERGTGPWSTNQRGLVPLLLRAPPRTEGEAGF